jgi:hypothetical protein
MNFDYGKHEGNLYQSIALPEGGGVLCPFIKSVRDLIGLPFIANSHSNQNDTKQKEKNVGG